MWLCVSSICATELADDGGAVREEGATRGFAFRALRLFSLSTALMATSSGDGVAVWPLEDGGSAFPPGVGVSLELADSLVVSRLGDGSECGGVALTFDENRVHCVLSRPEPLLGACDASSRPDGTSLSASRPDARSCRTNRSAGLLVGRRWELDDEQQQQRRARRRDRQPLTPPLRPPPSTSDETAAGDSRECVPDVGADGGASDADDGAARSVLLLCCASAPLLCAAGAGGVQASGARAAAEAEGASVASPAPPLRRLGRLVDDDTAAIATDEGMTDDCDGCAGRRLRRKGEATPSEQRGTQSSDGAAQWYGPHDTVVTGAMVECVDVVDAAGMGQRGRPVVRLRCAGCSRLPFVFWGASLARLRARVPSSDAP